MVETSSKSGHSIDSLRDSYFRPELDLPDGHERRLPGQRVLIGSVFVLMGLAAIAAGSGSIFYRMTHLTTDNGLVNGRTVRVSAPAHGEITAFYAQIGAPVSKGQVLAHLDLVSPPVPTGGDGVQDVDVQQVQLTAARQTLTLLIEQLATLKRHDATRQQTTLAIAQDTIADQAALVAAAQAEANAAQVEYQRYQQLLADGVVSRQWVSELEADWKAAEAMVAHEQARLSAARTAHTATASGVPLDAGSLLQNQLTLEQKIQAQRESIQVLERQLQTSQAQLNQTVPPESSSQAVVAPIAGIVNNTFVDIGEQVNRPSALLTVLDCKNRWVETLVSVEQASQINRDRPVRVRLAGQTETIVGSIEVIEAVSRADLAKKQTQALIPAAPLHLDGQPLSRVVVRVPPADSQAQVDHFCGIGQTAQLTFSMQWPRL